MINSELKENSYTNAIKNDMIGDIDNKISNGFIPAQYIIGKIKNRYTNEVPKSGCCKIKNTLIKVGINNKKIVEKLYFDSGLSAKYFDTKKIKKSLLISDGRKLKNPNEIHRFELLISTPKNIVIINKRMMNK